MFHHVSLVCVSLRNTQDVLCVVFCEDSWKPRKKKPTPRKLRKRNGERQKQIEQKSSGFWQRLKWILGAKYCATWTVRATKCCNYHGKWEVRTAKYCKMLQIPSNFAANIAQPRDSKSKRAKDCTQILSHGGAFIKTCFYTFAHTHAFTRGWFYTQIPSGTGVVT